MITKPLPDTPCSGCPWLRKNQTPAAIAASPLDGRGQHWFTKANLLRHWRGVQDVGIMLPCHMTDDHAPFYGGKPTPTQDARICVGLTILARREVTALMTAGTDFTKYQQLKGRRLSAVGLAAWAARLYYGSCTLHLGGRAYTMPEHVTDDPRVTVPWPDTLHTSRKVTP